MPVMLIVEHARWRDTPAEWRNALDSPSAGDGHRRRLRQARRAAAELPELVAHAPGLAVRSVGSGAAGARDHEGKAEHASIDPTLRPGSSCQLPDRSCTTKLPVPAPSCSTC